MFDDVIVNEIGHCFKLFLIPIVVAGNLFFGDFEVDLHFVLCPRVISSLFQCDLIPKIDFVYSWE
jgi:hypothetical protein